MFKSVILIGLFFSSLKFAENPPIFAIFKTKTQTSLVFRIEFAYEQMIISESLFDCNEQTKCEFVSHEEQYDYYNKTSYHYKVIKLSLQTDNSIDVIFHARLGSLSLHILGMSQNSKWNNEFKTCVLKIDLESGQTLIDQNSPKNLIPMKFSEKYKEFVIESKFQQKVFGENRELTSQQMIQLRFPPEVDYYQGDYFLQMQLQNLAGWNQFLQLLNKFRGPKFISSTIRFSDLAEIKIDQEFFRHYDRAPFKVLQGNNYLKDVFYIGRFFILKTKMKLNVIIRENEPQIQTGVEIEDGPEESYFYFRFVSILYSVSLFSTLIASLAFVVYFLPNELKNIGLLSYFQKY